MKVLGGPLDGLEAAEIVVDNIHACWLWTDRWAVQHIYVQVPDATLIAWSYAGTLLPPVSKEYQPAIELYAR